MEVISNNGEVTFKGKFIYNEISHLRGVAYLRGGDISYGEDIF